MTYVQVAIDGPSGAGKSTISKAAARELGFVYIDTGAMYRAAGLKALRLGVKPGDAAEVEKFLPFLDIDIRHVDGVQKIFLDREDVSEKIRAPKVSIAASDISAIPAVRLAMVDMQRRLAQSHNVIMDGRDIGTYVLPGAKIKIFLTASVKDRADRRYIELREKGLDVAFADVLKDMEYRDKNDSSRAFAPLCPAEDATVIDTSGNALEKSVELIINHIKERLSQ